ncbi:hypothetical protein HHK36_005583 [Tetracentron sinense]|uniref:Peroxidase n=1 Tax=Tetracentron sinense TaxID=13715 RepID=A0A834ZVN2_TETSI|nr:hypothetical protein HHK36_005583 [Tetracentron sinense]
MAVLLSALPILVALLANTALSLEFHFYRNSCPQAEMVQRKIVKQHFNKDPSLSAGLLRLHFHDCFTRGCDASVLLDSKGDNVAEKEASLNLSPRGFEVIDEINGVREAMQRNGTISTIGDVQLPGPSFSIDAALSAFKVINLDLDDLTTLLGAHSIGFCHCGFFVDRLYNFEGTGLPDPDLDPGLLDSLQKKCPIPINQIFNISIDPTVFMTPMTKTPFNLDSSFYRGVLDREAILLLDQELAFTDVTRTLALTYINKPNVFQGKFSKAMIKLGNANVLTGRD